MQSATMTFDAVRPLPFGGEQPGRAWRRHLRRHAPDPGPLPPFVTQRVHNVFHHLADGSLPIEQWDADAELAAIVHLLGKKPVATATSLYVKAVDSYTAGQRRLGAPFGVLGTGIASTDGCGHGVAARPPAAW